MTASADIGYDVLFVVHLIVAAALVIVLVSLRWVARTAPTMAPDVLRRRCPNRPDWALRLVHFLPVSGVALSLRGSHDVALTRPWIVVGIALYLVLAFLIEARLAPAERSLARAAEGGAGLATIAHSLGRTVDGALFVVTLLFVTMFGQF